VSLLLLLQPSAATAVPTGPFFWYDADHPAANYATATTTGGLVDQSGNGQPNAFPTATAPRPTLNTGGAGGHQYLTFDGVDDRLTSNGTMLAFGNAKPGLTVAAVVRVDPAAVAAGGTSRILLQTTIAGSNSGRFTFFVDTTGVWAMTTRRIDTDAAATFLTTTPADDQVHHAVAVVDYATATQRVYLDGALIGSAPGGTAGAASSATNSNAWSWGSTATPTQFFPGDFYELIGYDRALIATEVGQLWNYGQSTYAIATPPVTGTADLSGSGTLTADVGGAGGGGDVTATAGTPAESAASVTSQVVDLPPGLVDGDHTLLIASANGTTPVITPPAGWTALFPSTQSTASTSHAVAVFSRAWQAGDTDPTVTTTSARLSVLPVRVQGADPGTFLDTAVASTSPAAGATTVTAPGQTPATTGRLFVVASGRLGSSGTVLTWSPPPGMTEVGEADSRSTTQSNASGALFTEAVPVGVDTGTRTATASSSSTGSRGISFVLKAAPVAAGGVTTGGAAVLAGEGTLAAVGAGDQTTTATGTADLTGDGTLTATGTAAQVATGTATLGGSGTLTTTGTPAPARAAALSGAGTLTAAGAVTVTRTAALTGAGTLAVTGAPTPATTATLTGSGTLTATGSTAQAGTGTATLTGSGTLSAAGTPAPTRAAALSGSGTLAATTTVVTTRAGALTGAGTLTATPTAGTGGTAALTGTGVLGAAGTPAPARAAALTGAGTLTAGATVTTATTATLTGAGTLAVAGGASQPGAGTAPLTGTGTLATTRTITALGTATLSGSGTVTAGGMPRLTRTADLTGAGQLAATYTARYTGAAAFSGDGALAAASTTKTAGVATLTGGGQLTTTALPQRASATLTGGGTLTATGQAGAAKPTRDINVTVTGPWGNPFTVTGPTGRATRVAGPTPQPLTITGPGRTTYAPSP
jgi:fibronectin-binding autotransporter adhesin